MLTVSESDKFDWKNIPLTDCMEGNAMDTAFTFKLFNKFYEEMGEMGVLQLYETVLSNVIPRFATIEYNGMRVDMERVKHLEDSVGGAVMDLEDDLYGSSFVNKGDNITSYLDQRAILYTRDGGLELYPHEYTDTGEPSTSKVTLQELLDAIDEELERRL